MSMYVKHRTGRNKGTDAMICYGIIQISGPVCLVSNYPSYHQHVSSIPVLALSLIILEEFQQF